MPSYARYEPSVETIELDEQETFDALNEQFRIILNTTSEDYGHAVRAVHAKGHGIATGTLTVVEGLPPELAQGIFKQPGSYEAILRISTNAGDILDDSISLSRGIALKILGVPGGRLPGSEGDASQDFIMVNGETFPVPSPKKFLGNLKLLAKTTDRVEGLKKAISAVFSTLESGLEAVGTKSALLTGLGGAKPVHPLGATYFSQTAFRYGEHIAKFQLVPVSGIKEFEDETINATGRPDAIRQAVNELLSEQGGVWELRVQLCTDLEDMPVEDASVKWDEEESPFRTVATLSVPAQLAWVNGASEKVEDQLSFSPWHGVADHQPLGGVNRARRSAYKMSTEFRGQFNGCPVHEPAQLSELAG